MHRGRDGEREKEQGAGRAATQTGGRRETTVSAKCKITSMCLCIMYSDSPSIALGETNFYPLLHTKKPEEKN